MPPNTPNPPSNSSKNINNNKSLFNSIQDNNINNTRIVKNMQKFNMQKNDIQNDYIEQLRKIAKSFTINAMDSY